MTAEPIRVAFSGATGYVGRTLVPAIIERPDFTLVGAVGRKRAGEDVGTALGLEPAGVRITADIQEALAARPQVLIDYSAPEPAARWCKAAVEAGVAVVMATTAMDPAAIEEIGQIAERNGVGAFLAGNLTMTGHLMMRCVELIGRYIGDVEIVEGHPSTKLDSPSGTSRETAERINRAGTPPTTADQTRFGVPESRGAQLGRVRVHSMRLPGMVDHQEVIFSRPGELITIRTESFAPVVFIGPTLKAAKLVLQQRGLVRELPGIYEPD
jgi:4-hydroxy-tetrahydrodipicolinate reductase